MADAQMMPSRMRPCRRPLPVAFARRADVREVIERRRDADGLREKVRRAGDAEEEQIVTVRSHHE
eukprot:4273851-Prymnesium_polylepis.1